MEEEQKVNEEVSMEKESSLPQQPSQKISTPIAIIIAGFLVMIGIIISNGTGGVNTKEKTLSEQVGVSKEKLTTCIASLDKETLAQNIQSSVEKAMEAVPLDQRGTPYSVIIGENGVKAEIRGADSYENVKKIIEEVKSGNVTYKYEGGIVSEEEKDHIWGNSEAKIKIIEYSDFECPYCKAFHSTLKKVVDESEGEVSWVYRHWPIHQNSFEKLVASECVAEIKGNNAFWKYTELLFGLLKTANDSVTDQL